MINKTLAILAGGQSSRMNYRNKALMTYQNKSFIQHLIEAGQDFKEVIIIANDATPYEGLNVRVIPDLCKGHGPLSGIEAALHAASTTQVLCVACDMPLVRKEVLNYLAQYKEGYDVLVPVYDGRLQPLCAVYAKSIEEKVHQALMKEEYKLQSFIRSLNYQTITKMENESFIETDFMNVNTPTDFLTLEAI